MHSHGSNCAFHPSPTTPRPSDLTHAYDFLWELSPLCPSSPPTPCTREEGGAGRGVEPEFQRLDPVPRWGS